ncbi:MAG: hypothetical protein EA367_18240 [Leptolyngbya sp. DLM2.Bin15]|nr:MAG: hypothetical protein EA367_18240 [Leptolyngbya sp. DLM2.Bin15]
MIGLAGRVTELVRAVAVLAVLAGLAQDEPAQQDETTLEWAIATWNVRAIAIGAIALAAAAWKADSIEAADSIETADSMGLAAARGAANWAYPTCEEPLETESCLGSSRS